jgi:putative lumazine-binding protein
MKGIVLAGLTMICLNASSQNLKTFNPDEQEVLNVVKLFIKSMTEKDTVVARQILTSDGQYYATQERADGILTAMRTHDEYLKRISTRTDIAQERMWEPTDMVHKTIAMAWAPYDFHIDGQFSHCGIDCSTLVKTEEGWKISGAVFTMEPDECEESPLGAIKQD